MKAFKANNVLRILGYYLLLLGLLAMFFAPRVAIGYAGSSALHQLADRYLGLYKQANAQKALTGEFIEAPHFVLTAGGLPEFLTALRSRELRVQQDLECLIEVVAQGCHLPFVEFSLGQFLALAAVLTCLGVLFMLWPFRLWRSIALGLTLLFPMGLMLLGSANGLYADKTTFDNILHAKVGLYQKSHSMLDRQFQELDGRSYYNLNVVETRGRLRLRQAHGCYTPAPATACHLRIRDASLGGALVSLVGLSIILSGTAFALPAIRGFSSKSTSLVSR